MPRHNKHKPSFDPSRDQWVVRYDAIPYGWFSFGPFDTEQAARAYGEEFYEPDEFEVALATKRSAWKTMGDPQDPWS